MTPGGLGLVELAVAPGNLDGTGDSFPAAGLTSDGISPGASLLHDGLTLRWPGVVQLRVPGPT